MVMNRRNFLGAFPAGVFGVAALTTGQEEKTTEVKKAEYMVFTGPNGELYHPLVVEKNEVQYANLELPKSAGFITQSLA
jgi:hypothetical protein